MNGGAKILWQQALRDGLSIRQRQEALCRIGHRPLGAVFDIARKLNGLRESYILISLTERFTLNGKHMARISENIS